MRDSLHRVVRAADSIALERTECFGTCPAYRVVLARSGRVRFEAQNRYATLTPRDSVGPEEFMRLANGMLFIGFTDLPATIGPSGANCGPWVTDHPSVTVTLYAPGLVKRVQDYHGCPWAPDALRRLQEAIDHTVDLSRGVQSPTEESPRRPHN